MKKKTLFKNMRRVLPLCLLFLVAGLTSCNNDLDAGTGLSWESMTPSDSLEMSDSTEYKERVNLVAKEELPDWLITILDSMDEHDALYCGVFTAQWNGKKIYHILNLLRSSFFADVYNADGSPLIVENDYDLFKAEWCLIYIVNQDETMYETMISIFFKMLSFKTPVQADLQSGCDEKGICNPQPKDRANGEGLQIPLFKAAGLQIRPNR